MKINLFILSSIAAIALIVGSCAKDKVEFVSDVQLSPSDCPDTISYLTQVKPIIEQNCSTSGCHDATASGGYQLTTHADVSLHADIMKKAMNHEPGPSNMPLGSPKLNDSLIKNFQCWINQGKLNN